jgi:hypothetical protein
VSALASVIQAIAFVIVATALLVIAIRGFRRVEASIGKVHVVADAVNAAVNNVGDGEPTLRQVVVGIDERLCRHITDTGARLDRIEDHITKPKGEDA